MSTRVLGLTLLVFSLGPVAAPAQTGNGTLRGAIMDEQGATLPGVTVTATSPALLSAAVAVTDVATNNPTTSSLNFPLGDIRANGVTTRSPPSRLRS